MSEKSKTMTVHYIVKVVKEDKGTPSSDLTDIQGFACAKNSSHKTFTGHFLSQNNKIKTVK